MQTMQSNQMRNAEAQRCRRRAESHELGTGNWMEQCSPMCAYVRLCALNWRKIVEGLRAGAAHGHYCARPLLRTATTGDGSEPPNCRWQMGEQGSHRGHRVLGPGHRA